MRVVIHSKLNTAECDSNIVQIDLTNYDIPENVEYIVFQDNDKWYQETPMTGKLQFDDWSKYEDLRMIIIKQNNFNVPPVPFFHEWNSITSDWDVVDSLKLENSINIAKYGIEVHLNTQAKALGFDNINTISKFMGFDNSFRADAEKLASWCASVWEYAEPEAAKVIEGSRTLPSVSGFIAELPLYE